MTWKYTPPAPGNFFGSIDGEHSNRIDKQQIALVVPEYGPLIAAAPELLAFIERVEGTKVSSNQKRGLLIKQLTEGVM